MKKTIIIKVLQHHCNVDYDRPRVSFQQTVCGQALVIKLFEYNNH